MKLKSLIPFVKKKEKKEHTETSAKDVSKSFRSSSTGASTNGSGTSSSFASSLKPKQNSSKQKPSMHPPKHKGLTLSNQNTALSTLNRKPTTAGNKIRETPPREWIHVGQPTPLPWYRTIHPTFEAAAHPIVDVDSREDLRTSTFTVLSYNVLAPHHTEECTTYSPQAYVKTSYRERLALNEIRSLSPDILCLQEVTGIRWTEFWLPSLRAAGYDYVYKQKLSAARTPPPNNVRVDGCVIAFKKDLFALSAEKLLTLDRPEKDETDPALHESQDVEKRLGLKENLGLILILRHLESAGKVIVANTQLTNDDNFSDVRLIQACLLAENVEKLASLYQPRASSSRNNKLDLPIIICGHFNSIPSSDIYKVYSGSTSLQDLVATSESLRDKNYGRFTDSDFKWNAARRLNLNSAYSSSTITGDQTIPFTVFTPNKRNIFDYIWYSTPTLGLESVLGPVDPENTNVPGFPNELYSSTHITIMAKFTLASWRY